MKQIKVFAWNMQRGSSISPPQQADANLKARARGALLAQLCNEHHVGFITEPGNDLIGAVSSVNATSLLLPNGVGFWNCSNMADGQKGSHDCKNLIYSTGMLDPVEVAYQAGSDDCYRWPAAGLLRLVNEPPLLLVTFHATSGGGGWENARGIFDFFDDKPKQRHKARAVLVGGDMNSNHSYFSMCSKPTHQSGHVLDGFAGEAFDSYQGAPQAHRDAYLTFEHVTMLALKAGAGAFPGPGDQADPGYYFWFEQNWVRVSDHAPVRNVVRWGYAPSDSDDEMDLSK